ncbi:hypothetical protein IFT48_36345 [Pseudomonas fluorescens]|uniref:hypothetical protein n=1 Tax=Pseudomonas fluorescens TaxID=294 RepID=UPI0019061D85|nr:hypothetical protein [Pseudomonas fluorescens]MBD8095476.1 hypothetical protein [Pseudomonas fluorescens]MBD8721703.1 hypothetical protein [Pseudomonas fluorescens]
MNLNLLTLQESDASVLIEGVHIRQFSHHITQIFMTLLPKIDINGSSKIVISLGPRNDEDLFDNVLGVTNIFMENFDFKKFTSLDRFNQDKLLLEQLRHALVVIATKKEKNSTIVDIINSTAEAVMNTHFELETLVKKLSKTSKNKQHKVNIYRVLNATVGEGWLCEVQNQIKKKTWMHELPGFIDRSDLFKSAEINEQCYQIRNRLGNVVFELIF